MSQVVYRGNLSSAFFPFISEYQGRTVVVAGQDNNFNRQLQSSADLDKDIGIPQLYYCHNVLPNGNGMQSIGYEQRINGIAVTTPMTQAFSIRNDSVGRKAYMMASADKFYFVENELMGYSVVTSTYLAAGVPTPFPADLSTRQITVAHVGGVTYIYVSNLGCFVYNFGISALELTPLTGLTASAIVCITESNGYLIAFSTNAVAWSSTILATDFIPSLQTGAGGGNVEGIKGNITCTSPTSNGFTIFTEVNAVSVMYTGNSRYPFQFAECTGSGGVASLERVTYEADSGYNYVYTSKGFQIIQAKSAQTVFADLTDFLAGQYFEDFDEVTEQFVYNTLTSPLRKKLSLVAARYLVISYGISSLTHALVYDVVQKRFGKLKIDHTDCFEYELLSEDVSDVPKKAIALLQSNGRVVVVNFATSFTNRSGVAILGKYQYARSRHLQVQTLELENPTVGGVMNCKLWTSFDGKNTGMVTPGVLIESTRNMNKYGFDSPDGVNHSILATGCFNFTTIQLAFNITGRL
jgi:hypothetical protein